MNTKAHASEPTVIELMSVVEAITGALTAKGIAADAFAIDYEQRQFSAHGVKEKDLRFAIRLKQSVYRPFDRDTRINLDATIDEVLKPFWYRRLCTIVHDGVEIATLNSWPSPIIAHFQIVNDEDGRPTEVTPKETFPEVGAHATAPLDIVFGLHEVLHPGQFGRTYTRFSPASVLCALLRDPIWAASEDPLWPMTEDPLLPLRESEMAAVIKQLGKLAYRAKPEKQIRVRAWIAALEFMHALDGFSTVSKAHEEWRDEHGRYEPFGDTGVVFSLPSGGPDWPDGSEVRREFAMIAVHTLDELSRLRETAAALSWDILSINTVKHLHAMALGFLAPNPPDIQPSMFLEASKRGKEILETARWPV